MKRQTTSLSGGRLRRVAVVVAALGFSVLLSATAPPAHSLVTIAPSDLPSRFSVKVTMKGKGRWRAYSGSFETVGGRPPGCRSDKQMLVYEEAASKSFFGREIGTPRSVRSGAEIVLLRYADEDTARATVEHIRSYPDRCPKVTEWVCEECDGIWTTRRARVPAVRVGEQSVAWKFREVGNFKSNGYTVVARRGSIVVRVTVSRTRDVFGNNGWVYPKLVKKRVATKLTRTALNQAA